MTVARVAVVRYEKPLESVRQAVDLCGGLDHLPANAKVFIKPNIVFWSRVQPYPKWGVITTSRVVADMVTLLKERGVDDLTIGEGPVQYDPKDTQLMDHAYESLGYEALKRRFGVKLVKVSERPFEPVDLGEGVRLNFNKDVLEADFLVDIPVLKTHAQTVVSLGIKNLKGLVSVNSRKKCHSADPEKDLHFIIARLADKLPPSFTILDGIFSNERGPAFDGRARRSNLLVASPDMLAADKVGAKLLGYDPQEVPHLVHASANTGRPADLSDLEINGEKLEDVQLNLQYTFPYTKDDSLPLFMKRMGMQGLSFRKYDTSLCTYCSALIGLILMSIGLAWRGEPWDEVEILTGKMMKPTPGKNKTVLIGKCMYALNKNNPDIKQMIAVKTCPPTRDAVVDALHEAGIPVDPTLLDQAENAPSFFAGRYEGKPEFDEALFTVE